MFVLPSDIMATIVITLVVALQLPNSSATAAAGQQHLGDKSVQHLRNNII